MEKAKVKSRKRAPVPETLLDVAVIKVEGQKLTPPLRGTKRATDAKNPVPISLDSSSDDGAVLGGDKNSKKSSSNGQSRNKGTGGNQNKTATGAIPKQMGKIKKEAADVEPVPKKKVRFHEEMYPRRIVPVADSPKPPHKHHPAPNDEQRRAHGIKKEPAADEPVPKMRIRAPEEMYPRRVVPVADSPKLSHKHRPAPNDEQRRVHGIKKEPAADEPVPKMRIRAPEEMYPRRSVPVGNLPELPHKHRPALNDEQRRVHGVGVKAATGAIPKPMLKIKKEPAVDEVPVQKKKIRGQDENRPTTPVPNSPELERLLLRRPKDEPRGAHGEQQHDRWNPVFLEHNHVNNQAKARKLNRLMIQDLLRDDPTLRVGGKADKQRAEAVPVKIKKEPPVDEQYELPKLPQPELKLPANNGEGLGLRPEHELLPPINRPQIPIADGNGAQVQLQAPRKGNNEYCREIYTKLRAMFPNIKSDYIKSKIPAEWSPNVSHDVQFGLIVERLLAVEATWELEVPENEPADLIGAVGGAGANANPRTIDETYEYLLELFPRADPTYLRTHAERVYNDAQALEEFIEQTLKNHDYPTREQYMSQMRITEERLRYTENFTVQSFLEKFPDPFGHFLDDKRKCNYDLMAFEFLKCHFNRIRVNTISRIYYESGDNMSIAASKLAKIGSDMKSTRRIADMPPKDLNLLQEIAFVRHQSELRDHIAQAKEAEKLQFEELKKSNGLLECECCYDSECLPSECSTCENGHVFCNSCIITGTDSKLGENETHVACFQSCGSEFSLATLQKILKPAKFSILVEKRQAAEVAAAGLEGLVACPFCNFATIPPEGDKVFKCLNPECMKESCIECKEPNHVPLRCNEVGKADKARKYIEEKMTQALARTCYKCNRAYFKEEGCNKITCPCGAIMCYLCKKKIEGYGHFRGQGSDDMSKCPLFSDNARLNAEDVHKVADEAKKELLQQDPALKIDTEYLLPKIPPPSAGPHQHILQAPLHPPMPNVNQAINQRPPINQAVNQRPVINQAVNQRPPAQNPR